LTKGGFFSVENDHIGVVLKRVREDLKLSMREVARRSGLSYSYISTLEAGKHPKTKAPINPSPDVLKRLSEVYHCSYETLMEKAGYIQPDQEKDLTKEQNALILQHLIEEAAIPNLDLANEENRQKMLTLIKMVNWDIRK
jgi:transcriptional regulator with XRE-family HTH domain